MPKTKETNTQAVKKQKPTNKPNQTQQKSKQTKRTSETNASSSSSSSFFLHVHHFRRGAQHFMRPPPPKKNQKNVETLNKHKKKDEKTTETVRQRKSNRIQIHNRPPPIPTVERTCNVATVSGDVIAPAMTSLKPRPSPSKSRPFRGRPVQSDRTKRQKKTNRNTRTQTDAHDETNQTK